MNAENVQAIGRGLQSGVRRGRRARGGMTLVEIMVAITILVSIMSLLAYNVLARLDDAKVGETLIRISQVEQGLQLYAIKHKGRFPSTSDGLEAASRYMPDRKVPADAWGNDFQYYSPGTHGDNEYEIISFGKDGKEGGEDVDGEVTSYDSEDEE
jgi:general secretion pathway protein G